MTISPTFPYNTREAPCPWLPTLSFATRRLHAMFQLIVKKTSNSFLFSGAHDLLLILRTQRRYLSWLSTSHVAMASNGDSSPSHPPPGPTRFKKFKLSHMRLSLSGGDNYTRRKATNRDLPFSPRRIRVSLLRHPHPGSVFCFFLIDLIFLATMNKARNMLIGITAPTNTTKITTQINACLTIYVGVK